MTFYSREIKSIKRIFQIAWFQIEEKFDSTKSSIMASLVVNFIKLYCKASVKKIN
jgi:hypothetical protein